jgi:predicted metal-dependent phosphoesterase TrpH
MYGQHHILAQTHWFQIHLPPAAASAPTAVKEVVERAILAGYKHPGHKRLQFSALVLRRDGTFPRIPTAAGYWSAGYRKHRGFVSRTVW